MFLFTTIILRSGFALGMITFWMNPNKSDACGKLLTRFKIQHWFQCTRQEVFSAILEVSERLQSTCWKVLRSRDKTRAALVPKFRHKSVSNFFISRRVFHDHDRLFSTTPSSILNFLIQQETKEGDEKKLKLKKRRCYQKSQTRSLAKVSVGESSFMTTISRYEIIVHHFCFRARVLNLFLQSRHDWRWQNIFGRTMATVQG